jgi:hypothetical protein
MNADSLADKLQRVQQTLQTLRTVVLAASPAMAAGWCIPDGDDGGYIPPSNDDPNALCVPQDCDYEL